MIAPLPIRPATAVDVAAIADVCGRATRLAYAGLVSDDYLARVIAHWYGHERLTREVDASPGWFGFTVAVRDDQVVGVAGTGLADSAATSELFTLYVDPACQRHGIGRSLIEHALAQSVAAGATMLQAAVLPGNHPAARFYLTCGFSYRGERPIYAPHGAAGGPATALVFTRSTG